MPYFLVKISPEAKTKLAKEAQRLDCSVGQLLAQLGEQRATAIELSWRGKDVLVGFMKANVRPGKGVNINGVARLVRNAGSMISDDEVHEALMELQFAGMVDYPTVAGLDAPALTEQGFEFGQQLLSTAA